MKCLQKLTFLWSPLSVVSTLIEEWTPIGCSSEKEYEKSLFSFLHQHLDDALIVSQYAIGKTHVDLMVNDRVMVEIKYKLNSMSEYQRLIGQLMDYKNWRKDLVIVLVGDTNPSLKRRLSRTLDKEFAGYIPLGAEFKVIQK